MTAIVQQVEALNQAYRAQLENYAKILEQAERERTLLEQGQLDQLVESLQQKQAVLAEIDDSALAAAKKALAAYYRTGEFSIPKMLKAAAPHERPALECLRETLGQLVGLLEKIEAIEKANEAALQGYSKGLSGVTSRQVKLKQAAKAYERGRQTSAQASEGEKSGNNS